MLSNSPFANIPGVNSMLNSATTQVGVDQPLDDTAATSVQSEEDLLLSMHTSLANVLAQLIAAESPSPAPSTSSLPLLPGNDVSSNQQQDLSSAAVAAAAALVLMSSNNNSPSDDTENHHNAELSLSNDPELDSLCLFDANGSLNLLLFKAFLCGNESPTHDRKNCPFYHSQRDQRRLPVFYKAEQCDENFDAAGDADGVIACPAGTKCNKCHNRHELLYHPEIYKQRFCSSYNKIEPTVTCCHRGPFCAFAHTRAEIRCDLFAADEEHNPDVSFPPRRLQYYLASFWQSEFFMMKFKTLWCPYGVQHDWHGCLYAHTYQDCRRSPAIGYGSEPCPYWQKDLHSADYQRRCPCGPRCPYSHGSKEQLYHPAYYKTMPCADYKARRDCPRSTLCAFYHESSEKRVPPAESKDDYTAELQESRMCSLQRNFMAPPLFNLDDFEAFGHARFAVCKQRTGPFKMQFNMSNG